MVDKTKVEEKVRELIQLLEIDKKIDSQHVVDTPKRISKMLVDELFSSLYTDPPQITTFDSDGSHQLVIIKDLEVKSMCAHHWMPFYGTATIAYIPDEKIAGLSKFGRVVEYFSKKPQIQEVLTKEIVTYLDEILKPKAIGIYISCIHLCMRHRGLESPNSTTDTLYLLAKSQYEKETIEKVLINNV